MSHLDSDPPSQNGGHPLFPRPETAVGPDARKFDLIQVRRWIDGKMEVCPKTFRGCELRSWDQIIEMFGGNCFYQCVAQDGRTHRFSALAEKVHFASVPRKSSRRRAR